MSKSKPVLTFIGFDEYYNESNLVLFGAPFDGTTSFRPGARFAPSTIRTESEGLETYSPYQDKDLEEIKLSDIGDLSLPLGNTKKIIEIIRNTTREIVKDNKIPFMIGGEHLVSYPAIEAVYEKYNDLYVIHFDAHTDLRETYLGEKLSHATVIRRIWDFLGDNKIYQYGIRSGQREEFLWAKKHTKLTKFNYKGLDQAIETIGQRPVYITLDLDVLDPSVMSGTGTPEPGGLTFNDMINIILKLSKLNVVGTDVVELSPHYDQSGVSTAVACKIIRELTLAINK